MSEQLPISVVPWPTYSHTGMGPFWTVRVEHKRFTGTLTWSQHQQRFARGSDLARMRRASPRLTYWCTGFMADFCSKNKQQEAA